MNALRIFDGPEGSTVTDTRTRGRPRDTWTFVVRHDYDLSDLARSVGLALPECPELPGPAPIDRLAGEQACTPEDVQCAIDELIGKQLARNVPWGGLWLNFDKPKINRLARAIRNRLEREGQSPECSNQRPT